MKKIFLTAIAIVFALVTSYAQGINGKWKTSMEGPQGSIEMTFTFKVDGDKLTGTAGTPMGDQEIKNGKVNGNEFSFEVDMRGSALVHKGKLEGDVIKLKIEFPSGEGPGGAGEMTLKKAD